jgi:hypothetical protein
MLKHELKPNSKRLNLRNIELNASNDKSVDDQVKVLRETPLLYYYNVNIPSNYIKKLSIDSNRYLPTCNIIFEDIYNLIHDTGFPADNAYVTVILPSVSDSLGNIFIEFKIQKIDIAIVRNSNNLRRIHIQGIMNIDNLLVKNYSSYQNKTSYNVCKDIATDIGMGLMSNVNDSQDQMNWINPGWNTYKFLQWTANHAWVGETSFVWSFIDFYYNLNYIDVEKALNVDISKITWQSAIINKDKNTQEQTKPFLSNEESVKGSNTYFTGEKIINQSTDISLSRGYLRNISYYDFDGNWQDKAGAYKSFALDTITSEGKGNNIILKGDPGNIDFYNNNQSYHYAHKMDTSNMFPDYLWAKLQNEENIYDLQKIFMRITLPKPNFNLKRFEKINLFFVNPNENVSQQKLNFKLNGEWLVTGITYEWNGSSYYQYVNIVKREIEIN